MTACAPSAAYPSRAHEHAGTAAAFASARVLPIAWIAGGRATA